MDLTTLLPLDVDRSDRELKKVPTHDRVSGRVPAQDVLAEGEEALSEKDSNATIVGHRREVQG